jgi:dTDP-4-amino-4,6-dideoxygalactose transaminase
MKRAYPRHTVNLFPASYSALIGAVLRGQVLAGPAVSAFEKRFAAYIGSRYAVGTSSGRAALYLAFQALGFESGDEIIMPAYTFHIVPLVVRACGLKPIFVDVSPDTYNIDVSLIERHVTARTRAILATHMYGQPADMDPILEIAADRRLKVLEDCAHACGARYKDRKVGAFGDMGLFTFAMAKNMPCFGGGMITTSDEGLRHRLLHLVGTPRRNRHKSLWKEVAVTTVNYVGTLPWVFSHFTYPVMHLLRRLQLSSFDTEPGQETVEPGEVHGKYLVRLTNLQAAVGLKQLERLDAVNARVSRNAKRYLAAFRGLRRFRVPPPTSDRTHTFLYFRLQVERREVVRQRLFQHGVDTMADDMSDCTVLPPFLGQGWTVPVAAGLPPAILEIPNNHRLKEADVDYIAGCILEADAASSAR